MRAAGIQVNDHDALRLSPDKTKELAARLAEIWRVRGDRYSEIRSDATRDIEAKVEMSYIGG